LRIVQKHEDVHCDRQSTIYLAKNQVHHSCTKHINFQFHFAQEIMDERDILPQKIGATNNLADMFTKVVLGIKFQHCLN
jgi:hypothetical protein